MHPDTPVLQTEPLAILAPRHRAGEGNRNPASWMATTCSTFELHLRRADTENRTPILRVETWCLTIRPCPHVVKENTSQKVDTSFQSEVLAAPWGSHPPFTVPEVPLVPSAHARAESPRPLRSNGARADTGNRTQPASIPMRCSALELCQRIEWLPSARCTVLRPVLISFIG